MSRLPTVGGDSGGWGTVLNDFLQVGHTSDGNLKNVARGATYLVAASTAPSLVKSQADYVCDGTADQVEITAALNALGAVGGSVLLSSGQFNLSAAIVLPPTALNIGLTLAGFNWFATVLRLSTNANCNVIEYTDSTESFGYVLRDFMIDGNKNNNPTGLNGIALTGTGMASDLLIEKLFIIRCKNHGLYCTTGHWSMRINDLISEYNGGAGMYVVLNSATISGGFFAYNGGTTGGVVFTGGLTKAGIQMTNSVVYMNTYYGIYVNESDISIQNCRIYANSQIGAGSRSGVFVDASANALIKGNVINGNSLQKYGVDIQSTASNVLLEGNQIFGNTVAPVNNLSTTATIINNRGYIAPGETRTISGAITAGSAGTVTSVDNPFSQAVRVMSVDLEITTQGAASGTLNAGVGSSSSTSYTTMFNALPCDPGTTYPYFYNSKSTPTFGVQTIPINWATGAGNRYLNFYNLATNTGLAATYTITVMGN
jgi:hypothetical protein